MASRSRYVLSKIIPLPFATEVYVGDELHKTRFEWWQWRDRCFRVRSWPV